jgi:hypothetical protein
MFDPFDACWQRLESAKEHSLAAANIWNDYHELEPFDCYLVDESPGVFVLAVKQTRRTLWRGGSACPAHPSLMRWAVSASRSSAACW